MSNYNHNMKSHWISKGSILLSLEQRDDDADNDWIAVKLLVQCARVVSLCSHHQLLLFFRLFTFFITSPNSRFGTTSNRFFLIHGRHLSFHFPFVDKMKVNSFAICICRLQTLEPKRIFKNRIYRISGRAVCVTIWRMAKPRTHSHISEDTGIGSEIQRTQLAFAKRDSPFENNVIIEMRECFQVAASKANWMMNQATSI